MRRTKEDAEKTRQKIIRCAVGLFIKKGFEHTSLNTIAAKAGVTKGAIYWHFKDKDSILMDIVDFYDAQVTNLLPSVFNAEISPLLKIKCLIYAHLPDFKTEKENANFMKLKEELSGAYRKRGEQPYGVNFMQKIAGLLRDAKTEGEVVNKLNEDTAALSITLLITGTYIKYNIDKNFFAKVKKIYEITDEYFELLETKKGAANTKNYRQTCKKLFPEILGY